MIYAAIESPKSHGDDFGVACPEKDIPIPFHLGIGDN